MKKIIQFVGKIFIGIAIIFLLIHSFVVVSDGSITKDVFGFTIPEPPLWTSFVPYLGYVIGFIYQYFSIHGLVGVIVSALLFGIGINLNNYKKSV
ncbi:hypothetical protein LBMAG33_6980 [Candidatus Levyibacteriota bacterium]|nr:hypothetical protein LBMAG33_6980 [Candidatus Levybacteria bacterium]